MEGLILFQEGWKRGLLDSLLKQDQTLFGVSVGIPSNYNL